MLILTRRLGEGIQIGEGITVKVVDVKGKHVKIGITAPNEVPIYREEIYEKIQDENRLSSSLSMDAFGLLKEALKSK
jgi:carbon storage regulator